MSFAYSIDIHVGVNLTYKLVSIVTDTENASEEYLEAMTELGATQQAFIRVSQMKSRSMLPQETVSAASFQVMSSMDMIAKFLARTKHHQRKLPGTS